MHVCKVAVRGMAARAYRKRRRHLTAADVYERCLSEVFQAVGAEYNVEPAGPWDVYASYLSIPGPWYRGDHHRGSTGASGTRRARLLSPVTVAKERG